MPLSAALRSNLLRFVEDLLSYMTAAEKRGQLETVVLPQNESTTTIDPRMLDKLRAGTIGTVVGPRSREEAMKLQRIAVEGTRLGIPLIFADPVDDAAWPSPLAMAASWDMDAVEAHARQVAIEANARGVTWLATPPFPSPGTLPIHLHTAETTFLTHRMRDAVVRGLSGSEFSVDLDRFGFALALLRDGDPESAKTLPAEDGPSNTPGEAFTGGDFSDWHSDVGPNDRKLDQAVRRILLAKAQLGLFRDPFNRLDGSHANASEENRAARAALIRKSMVLLRNEGAVLPIEATSEPVLCVDCGSGTGRAVGEALAARGVPFRKLSGLALRQDALDNPNALFAADGMAIGIAADAASRAQAVMIYVGEEDCVSGPGLPRLGPAAAALLAGLVHANPHCVLVSATSLPLDPATLPKRLAAHLHAWAPEAGSEEAIGAILTGESSPQGKLPLALGEPGRPHFYPFGHGLTYGTLRSSPLTVEFGFDSVVAQLTLTNPHPHPVCETIQLYIRMPDTSVLRLRGFQRIDVPAEDSAEARFELGIAHLGQADGGPLPRVVPGPYTISIGRDRESGQSGAVDIPADLARAISVPAALRDSPDPGARSHG